MIELTRNERSDAAVQAAYDLIAEFGMEGLRTRDVAERAGMNSATLHYYFPTKETLIQAVVEYLMEELRTPRGKVDDAASAVEQLRAEFRDVRARLKQAPEQLVVLTELAVRSRRDREVARLLRYLDEGWRQHLFSIFYQGVEAKSFRPDLDVEATARLMMVQLRGIGFQTHLGSKELDQMVQQMARQMEAWVTASPRRKATLGRRRSL